MTAHLSRTPLAASDLPPGFADPARDSQRVFRRLLDAMARPGTIVDLGLGLTPPAPLSPAVASLCLALADRDTPLWLDAAMTTAAVSGWLRFHCGASLAETPRQAGFALIADGRNIPSLDAFEAGDDEYPERSTTLFIQVADLRAASGIRLAGPGIADSTDLAIDGLAADFWTQWRRNHALFPCGVDVVFAAGTRVAALPRSIKAEG